MGKTDHDPGRRTLLRGLAVGVALAPLAATDAPMVRAAGAADLPLLGESSTAAQAVHYVSDASRAQGAQPGANCSNCGLYSGVSQTAGTCSLFPSNLVAAAGWCSSWSGI